jgi:hypothetical protein
MDFCAARQAVAEEVLMKRWVSLAAALLALAATPVAAIASESDGGQGWARYGPFASGSTDSGTCGGDWANDTFKRVFIAKTTPNTNGTYTAVEFFLDGRFVTLAGHSPGACNNPAAPTGGMIRPGVTGTFYGGFTIVVTGGTFKPNAICNQLTCATTAGFVATVYGSTTYDTPVFEFIYRAGDQALLQHMWHNASPDRGGNYGDIRSS